MVCDYLGPLAGRPQHPQSSGGDTLPKFISEFAPENGWLVHVSLILCFWGAFGIAYFQGQTRWLRFREQYVLIKLWSEISHLLLDLPLLFFDEMSLIHCWNCVCVSLLPVFNLRTYNALPSSPKPGKARAG